MTIYIVTCHNVYNCGASLQAYALQTYLESIGHDVRIFDYEPKYLNKYSLTAVKNPKYDKPFLKQAYILAKLPGRIKRLFSAEKRNFDDFTRLYLQLSRDRFKTAEDIKLYGRPAADLWIAGSDQIWNPLFENGKDPVFFLSFVPKEKRASYAASIGTHDFSNEKFLENLALLKDFKAVSVREKSSVCDLRKHGIESVYSCDPVFLPPLRLWESLIREDRPKEKYTFCYSFAGSSLEDDVVKRLAGWPLSYFMLPEKERGPFQFLSLIYYADAVVTNSFHAAAFAVLFHKDFYVVPREDEDLNIRLWDFLTDFGLQDRYITSADKADEVSPVDWSRTDRLLWQITDRSRAYLEKVIEG